jgi:hypothetical protein
MPEWATISIREELIEEIRKAEESRIFISEGQRLEYIHRIKYEGIPKIFSEARRLLDKHGVNTAGLIPEWK